MTCDTCGGPIIKGNCYVYYAPDKKSKVHALPGLLGAESCAGDEGRVHTEKGA